MAYTSPFDENPSRRPTVEDLGGGAKVDGPVAPDPVTMLTATDMNAWGVVGAAVAGMMPLLLLRLTQSGGSYSLVGFRSVSSTMVAGNVTVTKNGTGDVTVSWTSTTLPGTLCAMASLQEGAGDYGYELTMPTASSVRIKVKDNSGTAQECGHTIAVY